MRSHWLDGVAAASTLVLCTSIGGFISASERAGLPDPAAPFGVPGAGLPAARVHHYRMSGAVRPLLFWIGRDDIGLARITWRHGADGARGYELLVGTDPARAPRALNRWGYVAEEVLGPADGSVLAMMTGSHDTSYDQEASSATRAAGQGDFRAIRARLHDGAATWQVARVQTPAAFTIHDLDAALSRVRQDAAQATPRERRVASGSRPGFLAAVAELLDGAVRGSSESRGEPRGRARAVRVRRGCVRAPAARRRPARRLAGGTAHAGRAGGVRHSHARHRRADRLRGDLGCGRQPGRRAALRRMAAAVVAESQAGPGRRGSAAVSGRGWMPGYFPGPPRGGITQ